MSLIIDTVNNYLPYKKKITPSGWISFNAVCCHHNGTSADTRQRGGIIITTEQVTYHCFNCGYKSSWQQGRTLSAKFRKLLRWFGVSDDLITKCTLESLKLKEDGTGSDYKSQMPRFLDKALPLDSLPLNEWADILDNDLSKEIKKDFLKIIDYLIDRGFNNPFNYDFYWSLHDKNRVIIPFRFQTRIVGYTSRLIRDGKPKYISEQQPGYVFNLDKQADNREIVIVCEGPFDAISIDGLAILSSEVGNQQRIVIDSLKKQIVIVPDRDNDGIKIVKQALEYGWSVSFPDWEDCKDINDSCVKYGRLATLYKIVSSIEVSPLKIQLLAKTWFKGKTQ